MVVRLGGVEGLQGRRNDVLFVPARHRAPAPPALVYWGGDVQNTAIVFIRVSGGAGRGAGGAGSAVGAAGVDKCINMTDYPEVMQAHRDNHAYVKWNLESTARDLGMNFPTHHIVVVRPSRPLEVMQVMQAHRDNHAYVKWNLESTARDLGVNFPAHHIVVVRPSRIEFKSISCYDNFVPSNNAGVPDHVSSHSALQHLYRLLQEVSDRLKKMPEDELLATLDAASLGDIEDLPSASPMGGRSGGSAHPGAGSSRQAPEPRLWWRPGLELADSRLTLAGFSKGCVVLNQLLHEFHHAQTDTHADTSVAKIISRISAMYWLDGGHAGGRNTWLTSRRLLETLAKLNVEIFVHVSPYQVQDEARPWIGKEEKVFTGTLRKLRANIHRYLHEAGNAPVTLNTHFSVVSNFRRLQQASEPDSDSSVAEK